MQIDRNGFYGDVVLDSVNRGSGTEDSISDQIYDKRIFLNFGYDFTIIYENAYKGRTSVYKFEYLLFKCFVHKYCIHPRKAY